MDSMYGNDKVIAVKRDGVSDLVEYMAKHIRPEDEYEITAFHRETRQAIFESISVSTEVYKVVDKKGVPFMIFGYAKYGNQIWAIGTTEAKRHKKTIVMCGRDYIDRCLRTYGYMMNWIGKNNKKALRYIERAGAIFFGEITSPEGKEFIGFEIGKRG